MAKVAYFCDLKLRNYQSLRLWSGRNKWQIWSQRQATMSRASLRRKQVFFILVMLWKCFVSFYKSLHLISSFNPPPRTHSLSLTSWATESPAQLSTHPHSNTFFQYRPMSADLTKVSDSLSSMFSSGSGSDPSAKTNSNVLLITCKYKYSCNLF